MSYHFQCASHLTNVENFPLCEERRVRLVVGELGPPALPVDQHRLGLVAPIVEVVGGELVERGHVEPVVSHDHMFGEVVVEEVAVDVRL